MEKTYNINIILEEYSKLATESVLLKAEIKFLKDEIKTLRNNENKKEGEEK